MISWLSSFVPEGSVDVVRQEWEEAGGKGEKRDLKGLGMNCRSKQSANGEVNKAQLEK